MCKGLYTTTPTRYIQVGVVDEKNSPSKQPKPIRTGHDRTSQNQKQNQQNYTAPYTRARKSPPKTKPILQPIENSVQKRHF